MHRRRPGPITPAGVTASPRATDDSAASGILFIVPTPLSIQSLRLVADRAGPTPPIRADRDAVAAANRDSAGLDANDARAIFAARVAESLDGGRAAILTPEKRRRLVGLAGRSGLRQFDANLVIAIVQDGARRGETMQHELTTSRLRLVGAATPDQRTRARPGTLVLIASAVAITVVLALIGWITKR